MDNIRKQLAKKAGIDTDAGVERFMGNDALYEKFLQKFRDDKSYPELISALSLNNCDAAFTAAHTLKGVSGNLSLVRLYTLSAEITEHLRAGNISAAKSMADNISEAYNDVLSFLNL